MNNPAIDRNSNTVKAPNITLKTGCVINNKETVFVTEKLEGGTRGSLLGFK